MQGKILGFEEATGRGAISGPDGKRYAFDFADWRSQGKPEPGATVDFDMGANEKAIEIYVVADATSTSTRIPAGILALLLGSLGIHKFYLGKTGAGLIMLLTSIIGLIFLGLPTFIMWVIGLVEGVIYLAQHDDYSFNKTYVKGRKSWF